MEKIIIIDDEISICSLLTFALEKKYDVQATTDVEMGLEDMGRRKGKLGRSERVAWTYIYYQMYNS